MFPIFPGSRVLFAVPARQEAMIMVLAFKERSVRSRLLRIRGIRAALVSGKEGVACPVDLAETEGGCLVLGGLVAALSCVLLLQTTVVLASWVVHRSPLPCPPVFSLGLRLLH